MVTFLVYIIRWAVALTLLYSCYGLLLRRETFHRFNRVVLNVILVMAMALPLCEIDTSHPTPIAGQMEWVESNIVQMGLDFKGGKEEAKGKTTAKGEAEEETEIDADEGFTPSRAPTILSADGISFGSCLIILYLAGALALLLHYLFALAALARIIHDSQRIASRDGVKVYLNCEAVTSRSHEPSVTTRSHNPSATSRLSTSCSWMRWIILNEPPDSPEGRLILEHEAAHVRLRHSYDMLLAEVTARLLWPLPFAWMLRADLRAVHEYEADQYVVRHGAEREEYGLMLIHSVTHPARLTIANSFSNHSIKDRLKMMYKKQSARRAALKAAYLLPLAALTVTAFARPTAMEEIEQIVAEEAPATIQLPSLPEKVEPVVEETPEPPVALPIDTVKTEEKAADTYEAPVYPGGEATLMKLLTSNLRHKGADGIVMVKFTIDENGKACDFNVMRSVNPETDAEAIRVLLMMDDWTPAKENGKPVAQTMVLPVSFKGGAKTVYRAGNASGNPRGLYHLKSFVASDGKETPVPFEQYKICMDDKTLMLAVSGDRFQLTDNDHTVFNYTGEAPDTNHPHRSRIYDSDATGFTLKWWSTHKNHRIFPDNDWCTERYESANCSNVARAIADAMMQKPTPRNDSAPLIGTWRYLGTMDSLDGAKKKLRKLKKESAKLQPHLWILTSDYSIDFATSSISVTRTAANMIIYDATDHEIYATFLDDNTVALSNEYDGLNTYHIWQRITSNHSILTSELYSLLNINAR